MLPAPGVASNSAVNEPVWLANAALHQVLDEVKQAVGVPAVTVIAAVPLIPPLVAEMVAEPALTAVTNPLADTVAAAVLLLLQVKLCPVRVLPDASFATAASCAVAPTARLAVAGVTVTEATVPGGVTTPPEKHSTMSGALAAAPG